MTSIWDRLSTLHREQLKDGYADFKRHVNFHYGQWQVNSFRDRKVLAMLLHGCWRGGEVDWKDTGILDWSPRELKAYAFYTGLLWQYAKRHDWLGVMEFLDPYIGQPMPVMLDGRLISQDIAFASLDLNRMAGVFPLHEKLNVLEIGAGYGRLAFFFKQLFPKANYSIVDIEPAKSLAKRYLTELRVFVTFSDEIDLSQRYDLVINTSSFDEMPADVSTAYLQAIDKVCRGHVFLNGMGKSSHDRTRKRLGLDELPYPTDWELIYDKWHPVNWPHRWVEKIFQTGSNPSPLNLNGS